MSITAESFPLDMTFQGARALTGIDEAGRGCLAGPVVVAAVTWDPLAVRKHAWFSKLADSKQIDSARRRWLYPRIVKAAERVRVAVIHPILIDYLNILQASFHGFELVAPKADAQVPLIIDGHLRPPSLKWAGTQVKGDSLLSPVSAAGVLAKVTRDALMVALAKKIPGYGLEGHKGYATAAHRKAIAEHGASYQHRKSFKPVALLYEEALPADEPFLGRLKATSQEQLEPLFAEFQSRYHEFSLLAARKGVEMFSARGFSLLPSPMDLG